MYTDKLFTGQRQMTGLGIYHYQSRFYSPKLGRFISADIIVPNPFNPQDHNRYSYVRNNPVRYTDPSGHMCSDPEDPTPTCDNSFLSTTKVGNKVVKGSGLDAGKPKVVKKNTDDKKNDSPSPVVLPDGGVPESDAPVVIANPDPLDGGLEQDDSTPPFIPEPPEEHPPCRDANAYETDMVLLTYLLAANIFTDLIVVTTVIYLLSNPVGWITLAAIGILAVVSVPFFYETYNTIQHIVEINAWRNYYEKTP